MLPDWWRLDVMIVVEPIPGMKRANNKTALVALRGHRDALKYRPRRHLELPHTPPRLSPARGPPQPAFDLHADPISPTREPVPREHFDLTPAFDPADPEPVPELDLDQSPGAWSTRRSPARVDDRHGRRAMTRG